MLNILKEIKDYFILTIIIFALLIVATCKKLSDREIEQIMRKYFEK